MNAGIVAPMAQANTDKIIDVFTERPIIGPSMPIGTKVGLSNTENQKNSICEAATLGLKFEAY